MQKGRFSIITFLLLAAVLSLKGQVPERYRGLHQAYRPAEDSLHLEALRAEFGQHKVIPQNLELPILIALAHYPELKEVPIHFVLREQKIAHSTRPDYYSLFNKKRKRRYVVFISTEVAEDIVETTTWSLPYNARIGVMGHELAHIAWYHQRNAFQLIGAGIAYMFPRYRERFEQETDQRTLDHHLAFQLLAWSRAVHRIHIRDGRGNLYKSPEEIEAIMAQ